MQPGLLTRGDPVEGPMGDLPRVDDGLATWLILPVVICLSQRVGNTIPSYVGPRILQQVRLHCMWGLGAFGRVTPALPDATEVPLHGLRKDGSRHVP